jgi:hypothetical protein
MAGGESGANQRLKTDRGRHLGFPCFSVLAGGPGSIAVPFGDTINESTRGPSMTSLVRSLVALLSATTLIAIVGCRGQTSISHEEFTVQPGQVSPCLIGIVQSDLPGKFAVDVDSSEPIDVDLVVSWENREKVKAARESGNEPAKADVLVTKQGITKVSLEGMASEGKNLYAIISGAKKAAEVNVRCRQSQ